MTTCSPATSDPFRCPDRWALWYGLLALLPRGRAWATHDGARRIIRHGRSSEAGEFEVSVSGLGTEPVVEDMTVLERYWLAYAIGLEELHRRACALLEEFFCATASELRPEWLVEYGFPDPCEPYETLCDKVTATGGATCAYLAAVAATRGWSIDCIDCASMPSDDRAGQMVAGCNAPCSCAKPMIVIRVRLSDSPAYVAPDEPAPAPAPVAGSLVAGCTDPCPPLARQPDIAALQCLIERIRPAHVMTVYQTL